ncbi:MAG: Glu/Leu/Phe/Val dehydrogenase dimerization domain-containing protein, partial [Saprospiraceae bacterium]
KSPEITFEWHDEPTGAKGWIVINSLRNGAAGGGTRMRKGVTKEEVVSLAKVMEIKFTVCGPAIGGAKSGIDFDPRDPRREEVLERWYKAVYPLLKNYYGTGGDMNVDEIKDVIPITEELGLWHPQEGIVNGHLSLNEGAKIGVIGQLRQGCSKIVEDIRYVPDESREYAVADKITGYGVAESVRHYYSIYRNSDLKGKRFIVQGWGNVASAAAVYLALNGGVMVGVIDKDGGIINEEGFSFEEVKQMFIDKDGNKLNTDNIIPFAEANQKIWKLKADIFVPGAASKLVTRSQVDDLIEGGIEVMAAGANVPFVDDKVFFGETARYADSKFSIIPDFIANCGMARVFAYFMKPDVPMTDDAIFTDVSETIKNAIKEVHEINPGLTGISTKSLEIALKKRL